MGLKTRFMKTYSNLNMGLRNEIVAVIDGEPITWKVAYSEIKGDTKLGKKILKELDELDII